MRSAHTLHLNLKVCVARSGRVCGLATHAVRGNAGYGLLDKPTTGLHFADIALLLEVIGSLKGKGNSIVIIGNNLDVIKMADYIVDLGAEGGDGGGRIITRGSPDQVTKVKGSYTGKYLTKYYSELTLNQFCNFVTLP